MLSLSLSPPTPPTKKNVDGANAVFIRAYHKPLS
jgi:hypothetical protein